MINTKLISNIIGKLLILEAIIMATSFVMALAYQEVDSLTFLLSSLITIVAGIIFQILGRESKNTLNRKDAFLVVTLVWIVFSVFGMLPYQISGYIKNPTDAFFETMSGFTTTGCTILDDVEILPHGMLFWRSTTQFIGGLGIVFFTIALLPSLVGGTVRVFSAESTGPMNTKLHPRLSTSAKWILTIYILLTVACMISFGLAGMSWFDAVCYSMSTTATGGFSTHNESVSFFHNDTIEYVAVIFLFLSGINFTLLYMTLFKLKIKELMKNSEFKMYLIIVLVSTAFITIELITQSGYDVKGALRAALFQVISFITTTGLFSDDVARWPHITWLILGLLMFVGASSGSTAGGIKCMRAVMTLKIVMNEFRRKLHPKAVLPVRINGQNIGYQSMPTLIAFLALYMMLLIITTTVMILIGIDNTNAISIALSCLSNVGPSLSTNIGEPMSWADLPATVKWFCSALMLMGRLEIFTVLVIFTPEFWKD